MAYIVCYLQRTPRGLHPASLVGACLARDVGSNRGAAIIGVTTGDGSDGDEQVIVDASRCGIDQLLFAGPNGLGTAFTRLRPMHVIVPWTSEGKRALDPTALRVTAPTWVTGKVASNVTLDPVLGVVAGTLPWVIQSPLLINFWISTAFSCRVLYCNRHYHTSGLYCIFHEWALIFNFTNFNE